MRISMTREALLEKLNERLVAAKAEDARIAKEHRAEEAKALRVFRERLREAVKWDYETAKRHYFRVDGKQPQCPLLQANKIATAIKMVGWDTRKAPFNVAPGTTLYEALNWTPKGEREPQTVCD